MKLYYLLMLFTNLYFAQNKKFIYEYNYIPDSTDRKHIVTEIMILNINKEKSEFYSLIKYQSDSTLLADSQKGILTMPPNKEMNNERVIKHTQSHTIEYVTILSNAQYWVHQKVDLKWSLISEFDKISGYNVQKATAEFGGRKWVAWFSKDIPIQDGPYKFYGLPGLILKIEDTYKNHIFELKGIENTKSDFKYPELNNYQIVKVTYPQYVKANKNYRKNPLAGTIDSYIDFTDSMGVFHRGIDTFRESEKIATERISRDNNILELDLLK